MTRWGAVLGALVVVAGAGCTIGDESEVHTIPRDEVPFDLLRDRPESATTTTATDGSTVTVYLVGRDEALVAVERPFAPESSLDDVLTLITAGPTADEQTAGVTTATAADATYRSVEVTRGVAQVELGLGFIELSQEGQLLAIAQTVLTLTGRPGVGSVGFTFDGAPIEAPRGDGSLTGEALVRDDFVDLLEAAG